MVVSGIFGLTGPPESPPKNSVTGERRSSSSPILKKKSIECGTRALFCTDVENWFVCRVSCVEPILSSATYDDVAVASCLDTFYYINRRLRKSGNICTPPTPHTGARKGIDSDGRCFDALSFVIIILTAQCNAHASLILADNSGWLGYKKASF